jgi:two-component system sensor histidine kinase CssS
MKKRIWLSFTLLVIVVSLVITIIYPLSIQGALEEQTYEMIEQEQLRYVLPNSDQYFSPDTGVDFIERREAAQSVGHLFIARPHSKLDGAPIPQKVLQEMGEHAFNQEGGHGRYQLMYEGATLFYVVQKTEIGEQSAYLISYMWDTYRNQMVEMLWGRLVWIVLLAGLLGLILAGWLGRYLRKPLVLLGSRFEEIAQRNWKKPFKWEGDDEFQHLSQQFEHMRQNLLRYDQAQKTFIQHASHELKTPVMVISSYAQSVKDGMLPKENLEETMDVIIEESGRMEQRVNELLYYTKLDSLKDETPNNEEVVFGTVAREMIDRFRLQREDVDFDLSGEQTLVTVDRQQFQILLENLLENALRYADRRISLRAEQDGAYNRITVTNDGEPIGEEELNHLFDPFYKGLRGKFGLGLAIVKRIIELHQGEITVNNLENGVDFIVTLPKNLVQ